MKQQSEILSVVEIRRRQFIRWFIHHVGGDIKSSEKSNEELYKMVDRYHKDQSDLRSEIIRQE